MSILFIATNELFADIVLQLPAELLPQGSHLVSRAPLTGKHPLPETLSHETRDRFLNPITIRQLNRDCPEQLSEAVLDSFAECKNMFLTLSDRVCPTLPVWEREGYFYELLLYWLTYFKRNPIRLVVFNWMPHAGCDYIVYCVARRLKIPCIFAQQTRLNDRMMFKENDTVDKVPDDFFCNQSRDEIIREIGNELWTDFESPSLALQSRKSQNSQAFTRGPARQFVDRTIIRPCKRIATKTFTGKRQSATAGPQRQLPMEMPHSRTYALLRKYAWEAKLWRLRRLYSRLISQPDYSADYIFFPLHYQPERTTMPEGGAYHDQLLAIRTLSNAIPANWSIVVKEHPVQFNAGKSAVVFRTQSYYEDLAAIPKVKIVDTSESSDKLVANAKFTSTVTGSSGWESLVNGIPCLVFGIPWYAPCRSCYVVKSPEDAVGAVEAIQAKSKDDVELDMLRFLAFYRDEFVIGGPNERNCRESRRGYDVLVASVVSALADRMKKVLLASGKAVDPMCECLGSSD